MKKSINKIILTIVIIFSIFSLTGCVSKTKYNELFNQVEILSSERDDLANKVRLLEEELDYIKTGPTALLSEAKKYFEEENYLKVIETTSTLHNDFTGISEDLEGQELSKKAQLKLDEAEKIKKEEEERIANEEKKNAQDKAREIIRITKLAKSEPNSAGGVDVFIGHTNMSDKTIKYITFTVTPYNAVGDKTYCTIRRESTVTLSDTGPYEKGQGIKGDYDWYWDISRIELDKIEIEYMDGNKVTLKGEDLKYVQY